jgi:hypothetical protein
MFVEHLNGRVSYLAFRPIDLDSRARTVSESIGHADVRESYVTCGTGVFEESSGNEARHIYANGSVEIERP